MKLQTCTRDILIFFCITSALLILTEYFLSSYIVHTNKAQYQFNFDLLPSDHTGTLYKLTPNKIISYAGIPRKINNLGFVRDNKSKLKPDTSTNRIMVYGDSITFGAFLKTTETYSSILEELQNKKSPTKTEVLITGRGNSPLQYAVHIKNDIPVFQPNLVIVQVELLNDLSDEMMYTVTQKDADNLPKKWTGGRYKMANFHSDKLLLSNIGWGAWAYPKEPTFLLESLGNFTQRTLLYTYASRFLGTIASNNLDNPTLYNGQNYYYYNLGFDKFLLTQERLESAFDRMFDILKATQNFCAKSNIDFLLLLTPSKYVYLPKDKFFTHSTWVFSKALRRSKEKKIVTLSTKEAIKKSGGEKLFFDFCHLNYEGNRAIAKSLHNYLH